MKSADDTAVLDKGTGLAKGVGPTQGTANHLLEAHDLGISPAGRTSQTRDHTGLRQLLDLTDRFAEVARRPIPKVPALRAKTIVLAFFEDSTRTRLSFELAAKRLSADTLTFSAASSSLSKGESIRDTAETIAVMGVDAIVVRHANAGVPHQIAGWLNNQVSIINAGDGAHQHPTQALQDAYTLCRHLNPASGDQTSGAASDQPSSAPNDQPSSAPSADPWSLAGRHIGLVGDIAFSRVARSNVAVYAALGAKVSLIAPPTLLPADIAGWPVEVCHDFDEVIGDLDVVGLLRLQQERIHEALIGPPRDYIHSYGLTSERARRLAKHAVITHPGPVNRGIEVAGDVIDSLQGNKHSGTALIASQVTHGVAARMAVLFRLLGENSGSSEAGEA